MKVAMLGLGSAQLADWGSQGCPDVCEAVTPLTAGQSLSCSLHFRTELRVLTD